MPSAFPSCQCPRAPGAVCDLVSPCRGLLPMPLARAWSVPLDLPVWNKLILSVTGRATFWSQGLVILLSTLKIRNRLALANEALGAVLPPALARLPVSMRPPHTVSKDCLPVTVWLTKGNPGMTEVWKLRSQ